MVVDVLGNIKKMRKKMDKIKILVVDDDKDIAQLCKIYLTEEGYEVLLAYDGLEALGVYETNHDIKVIVLDIMMPKLSGIDVCEHIRKNSNVPIIFLSAKAEDKDRIAGFQYGADDYLTKPFHPLELVARVKSQLRKYNYMTSEKEENSGVITIKDLAINPEAHKVVVRGKEVQLTPIEFNILYLLASNPNKVFSAEEIFKQVWKEEIYEVNNTVMVHIRRVREKIEKNSRKPEILKTVWGVGYCIEK